MSLHEEYSVIIELDVRWGDMDAFNHVNNIIYLQYFESARIAYFEKLGFAEIGSVGPILAWTDCKYKFPLTYPDTISIGAKVHSLEPDRFIQRYAVFSHRHQCIAAEGQGVIVAYDYQANQKTPIPEEIKRRVYQLEKDLLRPAAN